MSERFITLPKLPASETLPKPLDGKVYLYADSNGSLKTRSASGESSVGGSVTSADITDMVADARVRATLTDEEVWDLIFPSVIEATIIPRKDTAANIAAIVLAQGEIATTTDTKVVKLGDGTTPGGVSVGSIGATMLTAVTSSETTLTEAEPSKIISGISIPIVAGRKYKFDVIIRINGLLSSLSDPDGATLSGAFLFPSPSTSSRLSWFSTGNQAAKFFGVDFNVNLGPSTAKIGWADVTPPNLLSDSPLVLTSTGLISTVQTSGNLTLFAGVESFITWPVVDPTVTASVTLIEQ